MIKNPSQNIRRINVLKFGTIISLVLQGVTQTEGATKEAADYNITLAPSCQNPQRFEDCIRCARDSVQREVTYCNRNYGEPPSPSACNECGGSYDERPWPLPDGCSPFAWQTQTALNACLDLKLHVCYDRANANYPLIVKACRVHLPQN